MKKFSIILILAIILIIALIYGALQFIQPPPKKEITIATGSKSGQYYQSALKYQQLLAAEGVKVNILNTSGSLENIQLLEAKKADVAFIQNGTLRNDSINNLELLASIYYEPLWVFYRKDLKNIDYLRDFKSKKIAIGSKGSGTQDLANAVLQINGIDSLNTKMFNYGTQESVERLVNKEVDAIFIVVSAASKTIQELLQNEAISLFSFKRAIAYSKNFIYLEPVSLYQGIIDLNKNMPNVDKKLLATTATLITNKEMSEELTRLLLKKLKQVHDAKSLFAHQGQFPNTDHTDVPLNEEASRYFQYGDTFLEQIFPYWIASNLDRLKILLIPLLTLLFPIIKGISPLYKWSIRSKIYKWYKEVRDLELSLETLEKDALNARINQLEILDKEIKSETKVPLSYMREYYDLIGHLDLIIEKAKLKNK